jgi:hypothetical protein
MVMMGRAGQIFGDLRPCSRDLSSKFLSPEKTKKLGFGVGE